MQHDCYEQLKRRDAIIEQLNINITDLTNKTRDGTDFAQRRIQNTQLLKGKEPTEFRDKDNYATWAEGIKADLYPTLLELRKFFDFAEHRHINTSDPTLDHIFDYDFALGYMSNKGFGYGDDNKFAHGLTLENAWAIDNKILGMLNNLGRNHSIASLKIKHNNPRESGLVAWHTLKFWFYEEDEEYKHDVLGNAMIIEKCTNLNQLQVKLDQWLNRVAKAVKANPENEKYFDPTAKLIMLKRLVPNELEHIIRTNKTDYGTYEKALNYAQNTLQRHYDRSHPTPMDIGKLDKLLEQAQQPTQWDTTKHVTFEDDRTAEPERADEEQHEHSVDNSDSWGWNENGASWVDSVGSKGGKSGKAKGKGFVPHSDRQCYNCRENGHIAANCNKKGKGKGGFKGGKFGGKGGKGWGGNKGWFGGKGFGKKGGYNKGGFTKGDSLARARDN